MYKPFPTIFDVPADLTAYAAQHPASDILDVDQGMFSIVTLSCPHCRWGYNLHWVKAEKVFRAHLQGTDCRGRKAQNDALTAPGVSDKPKPSLTRISSPNK